MEEGKRAVVQVINTLRRLEFLRMYMYPHPPHFLLTLRRRRQTVFLQLNVSKPSDPAKKESRGERKPRRTTGTEQMDTSPACRTISAKSASEGLVLVRISRRGGREKGRWSSLRRVSPAILPLIRGILAANIFLHYGYFESKSSGLIKMDPIRSPTKSATKQI